MALKLHTAFSSLLPIVLVWGLSLSAQRIVILFYRKKSGLEKGELMRKLGLFILTVGAVGAFVTAVLRGDSMSVNFCIAASIAGCNVWISGKYMLAEVREELPEAEDE
jgi:hypothetical protein